MTNPAPASELSAELVLPDSETWGQWTDFEQRHWSDQFGIEPSQHQEIYGPYEPRSVIVGVRATQERVGVTRMLLPRHNATAIKDAGFLITHAAREGTPHWGKVDISEAGWGRLAAFDARVALDSLTHVVAREARTDPRILLFMNSALLGLSFALQELRGAEIQAEGGNDTPTVVTGLVRLYRDSMMRSFNHTPSSLPAEQHTVSIETLGKECPYGETDPNKFTTAVLIHTRNFVNADIAKRGQRRFTNPGIFPTNEFTNSSYIKQYQRGDYGQ